jgi:preprotein translocase subunit SecF
MELIPHNLSIDFVGKRRFFIVASFVTIVGIFAAIALFGFNWGVDFAGGSEIEVRFAGEVSAQTLRETVEAAGFDDATVQEIGPAEDHSFLIRVGRTSLMTADQATRGEEALREKFGDSLRSFDFNPDYGDKVELRFQAGQIPPTEEIEAALSAAGIQSEKFEPVAGGGGFTIYTSSISDRIGAALADAQAKVGMPEADIQRVEFVGPQVGRELRNRGILALIYASLAILAYIAFRFDTRFAPGAVVAMLHDIVIVLAYYLVTRREFNLTSIAVLLTIIGYSVNDTIVIYDRIRENMGKLKGKSLEWMVNRALNETLGRTILTSFGTALSLVGLLVFGVGQIWDFAAAMLVGLISGTYSTIYIATTVTLWLEDLKNKRGGQASPAAAA